MRGIALTTLCPGSTANTPYTQSHDFSLIRQDQAAQPSILKAQTKMTRVLRSNHSKDTVFPCPCCLCPLTNAELADTTTPVCTSCCTADHLPCRYCGKCVDMPGEIDPTVCTECTGLPLAKCKYCEEIFTKVHGRAPRKGVVACCGPCLKPNIMRNECGNRGCRKVLTAGQALMKQMLCDGCKASTMAADKGMEFNA